MGLTGLSLAAVQQENPSGYHLLKKIVIGGEGGWDYLALDVQTRLLYVTNGTAVEILNVDTGLKNDPAAEQPRPRPAIVPGTFMVLEFGK